MTLSSSYHASFITANGGTVSSARNAFTSALDAGKAYLNIHPSAFGGGEIHGFLTAIPEPSSCAAFAGLTAAGFVALRRRR